jgi:hypothetical protein
MENTMNNLATSINHDEQFLDDYGLASVTLTVNWSDARARHEEQLHMENFSL